MRSEPKGTLMPLLEADGLCGGYGNGQVLFDLDLVIAAGECVSLLGRNGMGKSSMLRALTGLLPHRDGVLRIGGEDVSRWPSHRLARAGLGLVPEGRQIFPNLTARENLVATQREASDDAVPWTLERVLELFPGLESRLDAMGNLLSGGEQQMLAIGRALLTQPRLLLLDDATEGLAPLVRRDIWRVLHSLKARGLAVLVVDKNIDELLPLVDRHYVLEKGRVVWRGDRGALARDPGIITQHLAVQAVD